MASGVRRSKSQIVGFSSPSATTPHPPLAGRRTLSSPVSLICSIAMKRRQTAGCLLPACGRGSRQGDEGQQQRMVVGARIRRRQRKARPKTHMDSWADAVRQRETSIQAPNPRRIPQNARQDQTRLAALPGHRYRRHLYRRRAVVGGRRASPPRPRRSRRATIWRWAFPARSMRCWKRPASIRPRSSWCRCRPRLPPMRWSKGRAAAWRWS